MKRLAFGLSVTFVLCLLGVATPAHAQSTSFYWYSNGCNSGCGYGAVAPQPPPSYGYDYVSPQPSPLYDYNYVSPQTSPLYDYNYVSPQPWPSYGYNHVSPQPSPLYDYWYQNNYRYSPRYYQPRQYSGYGYSDPNNYRYYSPGAGYLIPPQYRRPGYYGPSAHPPYGGFQPDQRSRYWNYGYRGQPTYPPYWMQHRRR